MDGVAAAIWASRTTPEIGRGLTATTATATETAGFIWTHRPAPFSSILRSR
jgi:hypothetical protein